jgi:hypothetical protein
MIQAQKYKFLVLGQPGQQLAAHVLLVKLKLFTNLLAHTVIHFPRRPLGQS